MTNSEAIEVLKANYPDPCFELLQDAVDTAIYALSAQPERKTGEWIDYTDEGYVECPFCHSATNCDGNKDELHFCFSCGADMRGEQHEIT